MNETIQEASAAACLRHSERHYPESSVIKGPDWGMRKAFLESNYRDGFEAGAEWAALKWIPVSERAPEELVPFLALIPEEDNEVAVCLYEKNEGFYLCYESDFKPNVEFWCPIPDSLLNFKP